MLSENFLSFQIRVFCKYINFMLESMYYVIILYNTLVCESTIETWILQLLVLQRRSLELVKMIKLLGLFDWRV